MAVVDRWHRSRPPEGAARCEHDLMPSPQHGRGDRWQVRWRDEADAQRKRNFTKKSAAESFAASVKTDADRGVSVDHAAGKQTVKIYAERWRGDLLHRESTAQRVERLFRVHVEPQLGHLRMAQVRPSHIRAWVKNRAETLAPSTLAVTFSVLASFFNAAVLDRVIGLSPCVGVQLPDVERKAHFVPTPDQVHLLAETVPARYAGIIYLAAGCGLRGGEITGLELGSVDFLRREVDVSQQLVSVAGRSPYLAPVKTKTSARTVELPEVTGKALARHIELYPPTEVEIDDETDPRNPVRRTVRLLFTMPTGTPIHRATWAHVWRPAARDAAGFDKGVGLHCLRHYFATLLIHNGASVKTVQLALGHSTPMITLNTYVGEWPEAHEKTRSLVDSALGRVPRMCPAEAVAG